MDKEYISQLNESVKYYNVKKYELPYDWLNDFNFSYLYRRRCWNCLNEVSGKKCKYCGSVLHITKNAERLAKIIYDKFNIKIIPFIKRERHHNSIGYALSSVRIYDSSGSIGILCCINEVFKNKDRLFLLNDDTVNLLLDYEAKSE